MRGQVNPYAPPATDLEGTKQALDADLIDASAGVRFLNLVIDTFGRTLLVFISGLVFGVLHMRLSPVAALGLSLVTMMGYYVFFEALLGRTPGKFLTGTRVVKTDGSALTLGDVVKRTLSRFVPFEPFSFLGSSTTGWHDRWSDTRVVRVHR